MRTSTNLCWTSLRQRREVCTGPRILTMFDSCPWQSQWYSIRMLWTFALVVRLSNKTGVDFKKEFGCKKSEQWYLRFLHSFAEALDVTWWEAEAYGNEPGWYAKGHCVCWNIGRCSRKCSANPSFRGCYQGFGKHHWLLRSVTSHWRWTLDTGQKWWQCSLVVVSLGLGSMAVEYKNHSAWKAFATSCGFSKHVNA